MQISFAGALRANWLIPSPVSFYKKKKKICKKSIPYHSVAAKNILAFAWKIISKRQNGHSKLPLSLLESYFKIHSVKDQSFLALTSNSWHAG